MASPSAPPPLGRPPPQPPPRRLLTTGLWAPQAKKKPIKKLKPEDLSLDFSRRLEMVDVAAPPPRKGGAKVRPSLCHVCPPCTRVLMSFLTALYLVLRSDRWTRWLPS